MRPTQNASHAMTDTIVDGALAGDGGSTEVSDAQLLTALRAGDEHALGVLWQRHEPAARRLAAQILHHGLKVFAFPAMVRRRSTLLLTAIGGETCRR